MATSNCSFDLVGGPFAVVESDPGVFTALTRKLGIRNLEMVELYDIEPWAVDHLQPHGLIFCFYWKKDTHRAADFDDAASEELWFSNQLSDDACGSCAILNVVLNCEVDIGEELRQFRMETRMMTPVMKGLAISSSPLVRKAHNSLARPADVRGAVSAITNTTLRAKKVATDTSGPSDSKRRKTTEKKTVKKKVEDDEEDESEETFHFIGYVPAYGKVWELDGLKSGPLEVGELDPLKPESKSGWMDVVRPALRMKMQRYGSDGGSGEIRFSLLAIVDGVYERVADEWEYWRKDKISLERRLADIEGWRDKISSDILEMANHAFSIPELATTKGPPFAADFGSRRMMRDMEIIDMAQRNLVSEWEKCVENAVKTKMAVEDELVKARKDFTEHIKRTHDYEPFLAQFVSCLKTEGLLNPLLDLDENGKKIRKSKASRS
ncbi:ubiquitin C-terminal hydrolase [Mycena floridula]|nr:ubiquitin C-terminal hydrolase [Mycena floridula]